MTSCTLFQGVMEEEAVLSGDDAFNAHFGECIAAIGDIDDDGYQGQPEQFTLPLLAFALGGDFFFFSVMPHVDVIDLSVLEV